MKTRTAELIVGVDKQELLELAEHIKEDPNYVLEQVLRDLQADVDDMRESANCYEDIVDMICSELLSRKVGVN